MFLLARAVVLPQNGLLPVATQATHSVWHDEGCPERACSLLACAFFELTRLPVQHAQAPKQPEAPTGPFRGEVKAEDAYAQSLVFEERRMREAAAALEFLYLSSGVTVDWAVFNSLTTDLDDDEKFLKDRLA